MGSGDSVNGMVSTSAGSTLNILPGTGIEWIVHNIHIPDGLTTGVELYAVNGSNKIKIGTFKTSLLSVNFHVTDTYYLQMKNIESGAALLGYDGIVMK